MAKRSERVVGSTERGGKGESLAEAIILTIRQPLLVLDENLRVEKANPAFLRLFHVTSEETVGRRLYDLGDRQRDIPALWTLPEEVIPQDGHVEDFRVDYASSLYLPMFCSTDYNACSFGRTCFIEMGFSDGQTRGP